MFKSNLLKTHRNKGKTKKECPQLSNAGRMIGDIPWNKGKKGYLAQEKHYNWKGGITSLYIRVRNRCWKYSQWRSDVFERDDYTCQECFQRGGKLNADHFPKSFSQIFEEYNIRTYKEALDCEELWNINNGRTLCEKCHRKHTKKHMREYQIKRNLI
jgi:hypothetical protein